MGYFAPPRVTGGGRSRTSRSCPPTRGRSGDNRRHRAHQRQLAAAGARVTVGGLRGYAGTTTNAEGHFSVASIEMGAPPEYPRVYAHGGDGGHSTSAWATDVVVTAGATTSREIVLRRDWASSAGGGRVVSATGNDDPTAAGWCGPGAAIDQGLGDELAH